MLVALFVIVVPLLLVVFLKGEEKLRVLPRTFLGKCSVGLAVAFTLFVFLPIVLLSNFWPDSEILGQEMNRVFAAVLTIIPGVAFVTGLISMIKRKERSLLVFVSTPLGLYLLMGAVGHWFI